MSRKLICSAVTALFLVSACAGHPKGASQGFFSEVTFKELPTGVEFLVPGKSGSFLFTAVVDGGFVLVEWSKDTGVVLLVKLPARPSALQRDERRNEVFIS